MAREKPRQAAGRAERMVIDEGRETKPEPRALRAFYFIFHPSWFIIRPMLLVIGYGNTLRRDDGVGPRVAELVAALGEPAVQGLACALLTPELAEPVAGAAAVVFVDAAVGGPGQVQFRRLDAAERSRIFAHAMDPRAILALAREVFGHAPPAWWLTIPVEDVGLGEGLSELARRGSELAVREILALSRGRRPDNVPGRRPRRGRRRAG
jgi:hydrogenase maturation protease